ncbi:MAG: hypothetical protein GY719_34595 [bacterium]|nr:hypothetical protein [bacterium]
MTASRLWPSPTPRSRILLWVAVAALIVRVLYFAEHAGSAFFEFPVLDEKFYDALARALVAGDDVSRLNPGFRPWLYPLYLATCFLTGGQWDTVLALLGQHLLGVVTAVLVADLAMRLFGRPSAGAVAGALYVLAGPPLFFEGELLITGLFTFLGAALLWILARADLAASRAPAWWLAAGLWTGLAAQARPNALLFLAAFPLAAVVVRPPPGALRRWALAGTALAGALITMIAFAGIQHGLIGRFQLLGSSGGVNFYLGNKSGADGMIPRQDRRVTYGEEYRDSVQVFASQLYVEETGETGTSAEVSRYWLGRAVQDIGDDPGRWLGLMGRKALFLLWNREIPNNKSYDFVLAEESRLLRVLPVRWWLLLSLGALGLLHAWRGGDRRLLFWIATFLALHGAGIVLFFVNSRYRIPMWPAMAVLAAGGVLALLDLARRRARADLGVALAVAVGVASISLVNWLQVEPPSFARDYFFRSLAQLEKGRLEEARADAERSVELDPADPAARFQLGNVMLALGDDEVAYRHYSIASGLSPPEPRILNNLGVILERRGRLSMAYDHYLKALRITSDYAPALINAALIELRGGLLDVAEQKIVRAEALGVESVQLLCARAFLERDSGREDSAAKILDAARAEDPEAVERLVEENRRRLVPKRPGEDAR